MVDNIKAAFAPRPGDRLDGAVDQAGGAEESRDIVVGVGYPDTWRDYSGLTITPTMLTPTRRDAALFEYRHQIAKIGKPMDRGEWWMPPQLVNAVNLPVQNALNFPAAILVKPFFDPNADAAFNYGAIGARSVTRSATASTTMARCSIRPAAANWWTPADFARFQQAGEALAAQYDAYEPLPGLHVNGQLTLGENIADVAGLTAAYDAYKAR